MDESREARGDGFGGERKGLFLLALRKGESVLGACRLVGISNRTAYNHRGRDPDFARDWDLARSMSSMPVELVTFQRAVEGIEEPVYRHGKLSHTRRRYSDSLLRTLLEAEHPAKYGRASGIRLQRKWLKKEIKARVEAATAPLREALRTVNVVNPEKAGAKHVRRGERAATDARNSAEIRCNRELAARRGGAAQAVVDGGAEAGVGDRRDGDGGAVAPLGLVQQVEQIGGRFDEVARGAERGVAGDGAEADQPFSGVPFDRVEPQGLGGGVMAAQLAGRFDRAAVVRAQAEVDRPGPEQPGRATGQRDDGRFEAVRRGAGVDDQGDAAAQAREDMLGPRRADPAAGIGGGGGERAARGVEQIPHGRVGGRADRDRGEAGGDQGGDRRAPAQGQDQGQRTRPMAFRQRFGLRSELGDFSGLADAADMDDQRIEGRPALGLVDTRDRFAIGGIGGETVDRLGRHRHDPAADDQPRRRGDRLGSIRQDAGVLRAHRAAL
jgi:hypothetical protein